MLKIYNNGTWEEYNFIYPYTVNKTLDESLDTAEIKIIKSNDEIFQPLSMVKIVDGNTTTEWIIDNNECERIGIGEYLHTFSLIETTEMLKGITLENLTFTQPVNPDSSNPEFTLRDVIYRIFDITPSNLTTDNKQIDTKFILSSDASVKLDTIKSPEFFFTDFTLYDALFEIGTFIDSVPRVYHPYNDGTIPFRIGFDELDVSDKTNYTVDQISISENQQPLSNYANKVVSNVSNLSVDGLVKYPSGDDLGVYVDSGDNYDITDSNAVITLPHKIKYIKKFEVKLSTEETYQEEPNIKEFGRWKLYSPDSVGGKVPYYKYNDNKIYNLQSYFESFGGGGTEPAPILRDSLFRVSYVPIIDAKIESNNNASQDYEVFYNQKGNLINADSYGENIANYIKRMEKGDKVISRIYNDLGNAPQLGHLVNNQYVVTNLSYIRHNSVYDVTLQLSEDYTRRAEFIQANKELRSWEIPSDGKVTNREINRKEVINFSLVYTDETKYTSSSIVGSFATDLFNVLKDHTIKEGTISTLDFSTSEGTYPTMLIPSIGSASDNLIIKLKALDNTLIGYSKAENWEDRVTNQIGVTYTDAYGKFDTVRVGFCNFLGTVLTEEEFALNYPAADQTDNNSLYSQSYITIDSLNVKKDAREVFNLTYQLSYNGVGNTIVNYKNLTSRVLGQDNKDYYIKVLFLSRKVSKIDSIDENEDVIASYSNPTISTYTTTDGRRKRLEYNIDDTSWLPTDYQSIAIAYTYTDKADNNVMVAINEIDQIEKDNIKTTGNVNLYVYY